MPLDLRSNRVSNQLQEITQSSSAEPDILKCDSRFRKNNSDTSFRKDLAVIDLYQTVHESRSIQISQIISPTSGPHNSIHVDSSTCSSLHETDSIIPQLSVGCKTSIAGSPYHSTLQNSPNYSRWWSNLSNLIQRCPWSLEKST